MASLFYFFSSCVPGFELEMSSVSKAVSLGEWTHEQRGRAGGTKLERALHEGAGCVLGGGSSRLCCVRSTPKLAWARRNGTIWHWGKVSFKECIWCLQHLKSQVMQRAVGAAIL